MPWHSARTASAWQPATATAQASLWNLASHRAVITLAGEINTLVIGVAFSRDGRTLATGTNNGTATLWNARTLSRARP